MRNLSTVIWVEMIKIFRSKTFWITIAVISAIPLMGALFMFVLTSAQSGDRSNWSDFLGFLSQAIAVGGLIVFGFVTSWVFGREYSDRTVKDLLALPVPRLFVVLAKFIVIVIWCLLLALVVLVLGLIIGSAARAPGFSATVFSHELGVFAVTSILTVALSFPVAFLASIGHGYLAPLGFVICTVAFAQVVGATALAPFCPWVVPSLYSGVAGPSSIHLGNASYIAVLITCILGFAGTSLWWRFADQI